MACNRSDPQPSHPDPSGTHDQDLHVELPCIDGMLAGTLALMTGYAEHQCDQGSAHCRSLMAKKIVSNLFFLSSHPQMPTAMAAVLCNLQKHWHTLSVLSQLEDQQLARADSHQSRAQSAQAAPVALPIASSRPATPAAPVFWHNQHVSVQ